MRPGTWCAALITRNASVSWGASVKPITVLAGEAHLHLALKSTAAKVRLILPVDNRTGRNALNGVLE